MPIDFNVNKPAVQINYHADKAEAEVLLTTEDNKQFRVTVRGSAQLLNDETKVSKIAYELLALANVYDVGGKTQSIAIKSVPDDEKGEKMILEQTRIKAKEGHAADDLVTRHQGENIDEILSKRAKKIENKLEKKVIDEKTSKSTSEDLTKKLTDVRNALEYFKVLQEVPDHSSQAEDLTNQGGPPPPPPQDLLPPANKPLPPPPPPPQNLLPPENILQPAVSTLPLENNNQTNSRKNLLDEIQNPKKKLKSVVIENSHSNKKSDLLNEIESGKGYLNRTNVDLNSLDERKNKVDLKNKYEKGSMLDVLAGAFEIRRDAIEGKGGDNEEDEEDNDPNWLD